jgi:hypothetical protein
LGYTSTNLRRPFCPAIETNLLRFDHDFSGGPKSLSQKQAGSVRLSCVKSVLEIEQALSQLPPQERLEIVRWLLEDLQEGNLSQAEGKGSAGNGERTPPLPDYSARRRRIFDDKVLPNMVLAARAEEHW